MSVTRAVSGVVVVVGCVAVVSASGRDAGEEGGAADRGGSHAGRRPRRAGRRRRGSRTRLGFAMRATATVAIRSSSRATGSVSSAPRAARTLALALVERGQPDTLARPAIRYRRTRLQPVLGPTRIEAAAQLFQGARVPTGTSRLRRRRCRPRRPRHRRRAPTPPTGTATARRRAGLRAARRCYASRGGRPARSRLRRLELRRDRRDREGSDLRLTDRERRGSRHEGEAEAPDRGRRGRLHRLANRYVLAAAGSYGRVVAATRVGIYGGYDPVDLVTKRRGHDDRRLPPRGCWPTAPRRSRCRP